MEYRIRNEDARLIDICNDAILTLPEEVTLVFPKDVAVAPGPLPGNCYAKCPSLLHHFAGCPTRLQQEIYFYRKPRSIGFSQIS